MDTLSNNRRQPGEAVRERSVHRARQVGDASDILAPLSLSVADMKGEAMLRSNAMTIGQLSRRTGVPIKVLRTYEDLGFLYTRGRSESNYRLFGEETLWCVQVIQGLRSLGLTLKEIRALLTRSCEHASSPISVLLEAPLAQALARVEERLSTLQALRQRILEFQTATTFAPAQPATSALVQLLASDPRRSALLSSS
ncbi:MAG TPA: MerR family transcriptional regulator [Ktedonobacteraceae bacterium]|nr:MerR family transcriptional regulator [Ktedonobacteraceae bacterium]